MVRLSIETSEVADGVCYYNLRIPSESLLDIDLFYRECNLSGLLKPSVAFNAFAVAFFSPTGREHSNYQRGSDCHCHDILVARQIVLWP